MEAESTPIPRKILFTLMLIQFTEILGFSIMIPVIPFLATDLGLNEFEIGLLSSIFSLCQLFSSPIIGKLSDKYGRKPLLIFSQFTTLTGFILLGFSGFVNGVWLLVLARIVDGLLGSNMTVIQASLADITTPKTRTQAFTISSGVFGAALILGPVLGGFLSTLTTLKYALPMFLAAGISLLSIALVFTVLPETYIHRPATIALSFNDIIPVKEINRFSKVKPIRRNLLLFFLYSTGFFMFIRTFLLIAIEEFGLTAELGGLYHTWIGIVRVILQFLVVERLIRAFGEDNILFSGTIALILAMIGYGLSTISTIYWIAFIPLTFLAYGTGTARPVLTSRLTNSVGEKEYATLLGINNSLTSLTQIFAPMLGGLILVYWNSIPLLVLCTMMFFCILVVLIVDKREKKRKRFGKIQ
ncbi:MAG: MFS transporter [Candidatus Lokiarchaeota archaeon]|nr:MFS transporter [Candidatus Lokiarchaeota archaeon]